jgi:hypothetical protein
MSAPAGAAPVRRRRRLLAAAGMLVPGAAFAAISAYVVLGFGGGCGANSTPASTGGCAGNTADVAIATFPGAVLCLVLAAGLLRGSRWARWPAVGLGAVLATVVAAGAVAGLAAMAGDGSDIGGGIAVGLAGLALAGICALPPALLAGARGAEAFAPLPD